MRFLCRYGRGLFLIVEVVEVPDDFFVGEGVVDEVAVEEFVVRCHVDEAVAGEVEEYHFFLACFLAFERLADGGGDCVA